MKPTQLKSSCSKKKRTRLRVRLMTNCSLIRDFAHSRSTSWRQCPLRSCPEAVPVPEVVPVPVADPEVVPVAEVPLLPVLLLVLATLEPAAVVSVPPIEVSVLHYLNRKRSRLALHSRAVGPSVSDWSASQWSLVKLNLFRQARRRQRSVGQLHELLQGFSGSCFPVSASPLHFEHCRAASPPHSARRGAPE